jgi:methylsterol monooxygenase
MFFFTCVIIELGADHHDYHHMSFVNNFSSSFRWWDTLFGTDLKYIAYKKQKREEAAALAAKKAE